MSLLASDIADAFRDALLYKVLPLAFLFVIAGLALSVLVKKAEKFLVNFIRRRRGIQTSGKIAAPKVPEGAGVLEAPACPECGSKMVLREARRGAHAGQAFWGCSRYPECRGIRDC